MEGTAALLTLLLFLKRRTAEATAFRELPIFRMPKHAKPYSGKVREIEFTSEEGRGITHLSEKTEKKGLNCIPSIEEVDFYGGHGIPKSGYFPESVRDNKYTSFERLHRVRKPVDLPAVLGEFDEGHIAFVGPAGSGKTTLLKDIARKVNQGEYIKGISMTIYVNCQDYSWDEETTPQKLFFGDLSDDEANKSIGHIKGNPGKVLFVIDALDTLQRSLDEVHEKIDTMQAMTEVHVEVLLASLISGDLVPGCRIITSAREHSIRNYPEGMQPNKVMALVGFNQISIENVIESELGKKSTSLLSELKNNPSLSLICSNPFLLKATLFIWKQPGARNFSGVTMAKLLDLLFTRLLESDHIRGDRANATATLLKLAKLSHKGIQKGRVVFSLKQVEECELSPEETGTFGVLMPANPVQKAIHRTNHAYFFVHKCFQEMFAALHLARSGGDDFEKIAREELHKNPLYTVVRRFLYGIMFDLGGEMSTFNGLLLQKSVLDSEEQTEDGLKKKREILKETIEGALQNVNKSTDRAEIFATLYEAGEGISKMVRGKSEEIRLERIPLTPLDMTSLVAVLRCYDEVSSLKLSDCSLAEQHLQILASGLKDSKVGIKEIDVEDNTNMGSEGMTALGETAKSAQTQRLLMNHCHHQAGHLKALKKALNKYKLKTILMEGEVEADQDMVRAVSSLLPNVENQLSLILWKLGNEQKIILQRKLNEVPDGYPEIEISRYETIRRTNTVIGLEHRSVEEFLDEIKKTMLNSHLAELKLRDSGVSHEILQKLKSCVSDSRCKIRKLTISAYTKLNDLMLDVIELSSAGHTSALNLEETDVSADMLHAHKDTLKNLQQLDLSHNQSLGSFDVLGRVLEHWSISELILMGCSLCADDLQTTGTTFTKGLVLLDISYNPDIEPEGFEHVAKILQSNQNVTLSLSGCDLNCSKFDALCEGMETKEIKVRHLDVSYNDVSGTLLSQLIDFAEQKSVNELELGGCGLGCDEIEILHSKLPCCEVSYIGLSDNASIDDAMSLVGAMVKDCGITRMDLSNCMLGERRISEFAEKIEGEISYLNLSDCDKKVSCSYAKALCKVIPHVTDRLVLHFGEISTACTEMFIDEKRELDKELTLDLESSIKEGSHRGFSISFRKPDDR